MIGTAATLTTQVRARFLMAGDVLDAPSAPGGWAQVVRTVIERDGMGGGGARVRVISRCSTGAGRYDYFRLNDWASLLPERAL